MTTRDRILDAVEQLLATGGGEPAVDEVAARAQVSKGGVLYHFPTKAGLVEAVVRRGVERTTRALDEAADDGVVVRRWLELSTGAADVGLASSLISAVRIESWRTGILAEVVADAYSHWLRLLTDETGDEELAQLVLLLGDGLLLRALAGPPADDALIGRLADRLVGSPRSGRSHA